MNNEAKYWKGRQVSMLIEVAEHDYDMQYVMDMLINDVCQKLIELSMSDPVEGGWHALRLLGIAHNVLSKALEQQEANDEQAN